MQSIEIADLIRSKGIKATPQRIAVYKFLIENPIHPDVETVHKQVLKDNPSFSKTTVYNSLQALEECGLILSVTIGSDKIRYDATISTHGHFICNGCGKIFDFKCSDLSYSGLENFEIANKNVYFSGLCDCCKNRKYN